MNRQQETTETKPGGSIESDAPRHLWTYLPIYLPLAMAASSAAAVLKLLPIPRPDLAATAVIPLAWGVLAVFLASRRQPGRIKPSTLAALHVLGVGALFAALLSLPMAIRGGIATPVIIEIYSISVACLYAAHCWTTRGATRFAAIFGVGLLYGFILENGGIQMGFFEELIFELRIPGLPAPIATTVGWPVGFYLTTWFATFLMPRAGWFTQALFSTFFILTIDFHLDPILVALDCWHWPEHFAHQFRGIPLINYIAWFSAVLPLYSAYYLTLPEAGATIRGGLSTFALLLPLVMIASTIIVVALTAVVIGIDSAEMGLFLEFYLRGK